MKKMHKNEKKFGNEKNFRFFSGFQGFEKLGQGIYNKQ